MWKSGATATINHKLELESSPTSFDQKMLKLISGPQRTLPSPEKLARPELPTVSCEANRYKERLHKERAVAPPNLEGGDYMLFPFVREREHEADVRERVGLSPEQWYGRTRKPYDTPDTVGSLFLDSEVCSRQRPGSLPWPSHSLSCCV